MKEGEEKYWVGGSKKEKDPERGKTDRDIKRVGRDGQHDLLSKFYI
jgi:hypothetical protein